MSEIQETPEGLHRMQYAIHILEEVLGWPSKGNAEMIADCILSVSKSKKLSVKQAHDYIVRAVKLAREQCVEVNRFWFQGGEYINVRPEKKEREYKPGWDVTRTAQEQASPEFGIEARKKLAEIAGKPWPK